MIYWNPKDNRITCGKCGCSFTADNKDEAIEEMVKHKKGGYTEYPECLEGDRNRLNKFLRGIGIVFAPNGRLISQNIEEVSDG